MGDRSERALRHLLPHCGADERGAAIVEFAIVVPLLFALIFGMFSGGLAYNRKLTLTNAVREGSRYGATLAVAQAPATSPSCGDQINCWLAQVAAVTRQAADGELASSVASSEVCVAYISNGAAPNDATRSQLFRAGVADPHTPGGTCFNDGGLPGDRRVQVTAQRAGKLEYLVSSTNLTLSSKSITRFEAVS